MSTRKGRYGDPRKRKPIGDLYAAAQPSGVADPRRLGGNMVDPLDDPHARGNVFVDATDCVLMDGMEACLVEGVLNGAATGDRIFMALDGRVNKSTDRVRTGYMFGPDGAAAIITELLALADRAGPAMLDDVTRRLHVLYRDKNVDLAWLRAAIDNVIEDA